MNKVLYKAYLCKCVCVCVCVWMDTMSEIFLMHLLMGLAEWTVYTAKTK